MESRELSEDTPVPTPAWKESFKKAIIPEVLYTSKNGGAKQPGP